MQNDSFDNNSLILAAEDFPNEKFESAHYFSTHDKRCITKLIAHGPVLLKGARGSGKSALMIEASRKMFPMDKKRPVFGIYISLRHLELLRSEGKKYEELLCGVIRNAVNSSDCDIKLPEGENDTAEIQKELTLLAEKVDKRIVLLFDDAAHIGREASLNDFFDIFRTISNSVISCKASIYPGVTRFGTRFDVYNDATVIDISRNESAPDYSETFSEIIEKRFSEVFTKDSFTKELDQTAVATLLARAVLGNMRAFIFACNTLVEQVGGSKIRLGSLSETFKTLASNYYWPLIEEIQPKLGVYEPMVDPAKEIAEIIFQDAAAKKSKSVIILREIVNRLLKPLEILEYTGFISRREVSRSMKSRGRGTRYSLNICNLLEDLEGGKMTPDLAKSLIDATSDDAIEYHRGGRLNLITLPEPYEDHDLGILSKPIDILKRSPAYPYGLTERRIQMLRNEGFNTVSDITYEKDETIKALDRFGDASLSRIRSVIQQAVWM